MWVLEIVKKFSNLLLTPDSTRGIISFKINEVERSFYEINNEKFYYCHQLWEMWFKPTVYTHCLVSFL
jgi:hypothetical protein